MHVIYIMVILELYFLISRRNCSLSMTEIIVVAFVLHLISILSRDAAREEEGLFVVEREDISLYGILFFIKPNTIRTDSFCNSTKLWNTIETQNDSTEISSNKLIINTTISVSINALTIMRGVSIAATPIMIA